MRSFLEKISNSLWKKYRFTLENSVEGVTVLQYAPDGWSDEFVIQRNKIFRGVFRTYSDVTLNFIKEGKDFIEKVYDEQGVNAIIQLKIERWSNDYEYVEIFNGVINLFTLKKTDISVDVQIEDNAQLAKLMNRKKTEVNIWTPRDLDGNAFVGIYADVDFILPDQQIRSTNTHSFEGVVSDEGTIIIPLVLEHQTFPEAQDVEPNGTIKEKAFFRESQASYTPLSISMFLTAEIEQDTAIQYVSRIQIYDGNDVLQHTEVLSFAAITSNELLLLDAFTFNVQPDYSLVYEFIWQREQGTGDVIFNTYNGVPTYIQLEAGTPLFPAKKIKGMPIFDCFKNLVKITSGFDFSSSVYDLFTGTDNFFVTQGKNIRGITSDFSLSLEDLAVTSFAMKGTGLGLEGDTVVCEPIDHFYSPVVTLDISETKTSIEIEVKDDYFSSIEVGYKKSAFDAKYGLGEPNTKAEYSTPINYDKKENITATYRGDTTGIVKLREKPTGTQENEGVSGDDDIWVLDVFKDENDDWTVRQQEGFDNAPQGWFNLRYTIRRMTVRHKLKEFLRFISDPLRLQRKDKYSLLQSKETGGDLLNELSDVPLDELPLPIFIPELIIVDAPVSIADINSMDYTGLIKVDSDLYGWIDTERSTYNYSTELAKFALIRADLDNVTPI